VELVVRDRQLTAPAPAGIVDREHELAAVRAFLDGLRDGPRGMLVEGAAGIGKTALWRQALEEAQARGCLVLRCVAEQAEARLPFVGLGDLVGDMADELLPALPLPQREALEVALVRRVNGSGRAPDPKAVGVGFHSLLLRAARNRPVVVAVDDVQWLDPATAGALAFAARRLDAQPVGVLATVRAPLAEPDPLGLERALGAGRFARARLGPLSLRHLRALLEQRLGHAHPRPILLRIAWLSGGNPLFALEISRALGPAPALEPGAPLPVPDSLRELVAHRVAALCSEGRAALLAAAALSHPTVELVERASSACGLAAAGDSGMLELEGERVVFAHPLYASAVYRSAAGGGRRELHRRLAVMLPDPEERARHHALAARGPDERVAATLEQAAASARARGAWETAGELLEHARALTPPARQEAALERGVRAAEHHIHAGDRPRARTLLERLLAGAPPGPSRSDALRLLAQIRFHEQGFAGAAELLEEALEHARDPGLLVAIELDLSYVRANHFSDFDSADAHADSALAHAARTENRGLLGAALADRAMVDFLLGRGVDWSKVERSLALEGAESPLPLQVRPSAIAACLKLWVGRLAEARAELMALRLAAIDSGDESDLAYMLSWLTFVETLSGDLASAAHFAEEAAVQAALAGSEFNRAWALAQRALVHAHRGAVDDARADAAAAADICERFEGTNPLLWAAGALGLLELSLGDAAAAWAASERAAEAFESDRLREPPALCLAPALEALIALGELERAERLLDRFERRARELDRVPALATGARCRGLLLAARGDLRGAQAALERALAEHARIEMPFELARTLLVEGQIRRRRKQKRAARESLDRALALFEPMGARLWAQRTRDELARLGRPASQPDELTASERRVVDLAVQGLANKEIAGTLFVAVHTVEVHLSRAYAKLGVRSRTQLARRLAQA
jgi:DNA-binding CsgD family transcriptional regulator